MDHKISAASTQEDARIVRTRDALRDALLVIIEQKPFDQVTIREIAAEAGIGYATFFRHYPSKAALLEAVAAEQISELLARAFPLLSETDSAPASLALCRYVDERRALWTALLTGGAAGMLREEFIRQAGAIAKVQSKSHSSLPSELAVIFGVIGTVEILAWWLKRGRSMSVEKIAMIIDRLVVAPTFGG